jgi:hypothetical protein
MSQDCPGANNYQLPSLGCQNEDWPVIKAEQKKILDWF